MSESSPVRSPGKAEGDASPKSAFQKDNTPTWTASGLLLTDLWREPLHATSRTADRLGHIDFGMLVPPVRAFIYCMLVPYLCYPIAALSAYGFVRCLKTLVLPKYYRREKYAEHVMYAIQKRVYDKRSGRVTEYQVEDVAEFTHALSVTDGARNQFVDDPATPNTAYYVVEQKVMRAEAIFTGENWAWAFISDSCRYLTPIALAYLFHPSCKRLTTDLSLLVQGRLRVSQVRHPVLNFFRSYNDYNRALQRINLTKPAPRGAKPWSRNL